MFSEIDKSEAITDQELMKRYGISRTTIDFFYCGPYRYTKLKDAIAQAERNKLSLP